LEHFIKLIGYSIRLKIREEIVFAPTINDLC